MIFKGIQDLLSFCAEFLTFSLSFLSFESYAYDLYLLSFLLFGLVRSMDIRWKVRGYRHGYMAILWVIPWRSSVLGTLIHTKDLFDTTL
jgi:hypothetical protein